MSEKSVHYGKPKEVGLLNPEEIAEYIFTEFTPLSQMNQDEAKKHLANLIYRYANYCMREAVNLGISMPEDNTLVMVKVE